MKFLEIVFFLEDCDKEDTSFSLANKPKNSKMCLFYYKILILNLPPIEKVMENQNFNFVYLGTMILCLVQTY